MNEDHTKRLLEAVERGEMKAEQAFEKLRHLPYEDLGFARVDHHRAIRVGFPEVVFGLGKEISRLTDIVGARLEAGGTLLVTRLEEEPARIIRKNFPSIAFIYHRDARMLVYEPDERVIRGLGRVAVVSAGTSDIPVAEEAAVTAELMGNEVDRIYDVGVAGIHRLFAHRESLVAARVLVVVAGMEGALPSVVGGLVSSPVIAVPTSIGYGASFNGIAPLLAMLNSCAAGITVVNIDNGFGAGYAAALINRRRSED